MALTHPQVLAPLPSAPDAIAISPHLPPAPARRRFGQIPDVMTMPHLTQVQRDSFAWFLTTGLRELLDEISPITDFSGQALTLHFGAFRLGAPRYDAET